MFGLQFGDEIAALKKLPKFLWRIESNYKVAPSVRQRPAVLMTPICNKKARGKGQADSLSKAIIRACPF